MASTLASSLSCWRMSPPTSFGLPPTVRLSRGERGADVVLVEPELAVKLDAPGQRHEVARPLAAELAEGVARRAAHEVDVRRGEHLLQGQVARVLLPLLAAKLQHVAVEHPDDLLALRDVLDGLREMADRVGDEVGVEAVEVDDRLLLGRVAEAPSSVLARCALVGIGAASNVTFAFPHASRSRWSVPYFARSHWRKAARLTGE